MVTKSPEMYFGVLVLPNTAKNAGEVSDQDVFSVPSTLSFREEYDDAVILHQSDQSNGADISALLYVPSISNSTDCGQDTISSNVTTLADLPSGYNLAAIAPLTSRSCATVWMNQAHQDGAANVIFYDPDLSSSKTLSSGFLGDTSDMTYSVYYISNTVGYELIQYLSEYSGNMTAVPNAERLVNYYDFRDYVRVAVEIDSPSSGRLPGLWVFLVIALALVLGAIASTSVILHLLQYRNRRRLRRRIENGEIDLETLGIKRLTVPKWILEKLPIKTYVPGEYHFTSNTVSTPEPAHHHSSTAAGALLAIPRTLTPFNRLKSPKSENQDKISESEPNASGGYSQSSCPICLDDYEPNVTKVRELPCMHIYHQDCIDNFLEHQSSLCPLCKQSALPKGYIPASLRITNATVRRERRVRRALERARRAGVEAPDIENLPAEEPFRLPTIRGILRRSSTSRVADVELQDLSVQAGEPAEQHENLARPEQSEQSSVTVSATNPPATAEQDISSRPRHHNRGIRTRRQDRAVNTPGAVVASDGTVFVVEEHEQPRTRLGRAMHAIFPFIP
ncbi:uncharacterized protein V1516DRAFT_668397 [Lipomyces oligophaga]|uniref:uncharacterized protein n=1 Tax=Lipomyces oligophaga TaxID=45792 RepID=UPI0034CD9931